MRPPEKLPKLPSLVSAFEKFNQRIPNHLEASIAFGLYMASLRAGLGEQGATDLKYRNLEQAYLTEHEIERYWQSATQLLVQFANGVLEKERAELLSQALREYRVEASKGYRAFRFSGALEAVTGAFIWTVLLIAISVLVAWAGIDLLEIYRKIAGAQH